MTRLRKIFALHGLPQVIVSDNGPAFIGPEIKEFFQKNGVRHLYTAPYHPASNGQAERMVQTFKESMKKLQHGDIETKLSRLLFGYRTTPSSVTGKTPAELLFNRQLRSTCHLLRPSMHSRRNEVETEQAEFCVVGEGNCGKDEEDEAEVTERRCSGRSIRKPQRLIEEDVNKGLWGRIVIISL